MSATNHEALIRELVHRGLLSEGGAPLVYPPADDRPWFVTALLGAAGWLAAVFVLFFVATVFEPDDAAGFAALGAVMLACAFGLYAGDRDNAFLDQLALALSLAGQIAIGFAAAQATDSAAATAGLVTLMQIALLFLLPNRLARILAALFACVAWALTVRFVWWGESIFEGSRQSVELLPALLGWLAIWAPIMVATQALVANESRWMTRGWQRVARPALTGSLLALSVATFASEPLASLQFWAPPGQYSNWLVLWPLLGVGAALFAAVCAFRIRNHALLGAAIAGALLHVVQFYYLLGASLLIKSGIMLITGSVLLAVAAALRKRALGGEGSER